eukprot:g12516.t1
MLCLAAMLTATQAVQANRFPSVLDRPAVQTANGNSTATNSDATTGALERTLFNNAAAGPMELPECVCNPDAWREAGTLFRWSFSDETGGPDLNEPLVTDRPDFTEASTTVGRNVSQLEFGYTYVYDSNGGVSERTSSFGEPLLRHGLIANWLEFRVALFPVQQRVNTAGRSNTTAGTEDLYLGFKIGLTPQAGILPEMAIIPQMTVPTGSNRFTNDEALPGANLIYAWEINDILTTAGSTQANRSIDETTGRAYTEIAQSWTLGVSLTDEFGLYTECHPMGVLRARTVMRRGLYAAGAIVIAFTMAPRAIFAQGTTPTLLVLKNGRVVDGRITQNAGGYLVDFKNGSMLVPRSQVLLQAGSRREAYLKLREASPRKSITGNLRLARWCIVNQLYSQAKREINEALALNPSHGEARRMMVRLEEMLARDAKPEVRPRPTLAERMTAPPAKSLAGLSRDAARDFVGKVQPILMNSCATSGCHGPQSKNGFRLSRVRISNSGRRGLSERNLATTMRFIDPRRPDASPLLTKPTGNHGRRGQPVFRGRAGARQHELLRQWVRDVARETTAPKLAEEKPEQKVAPETRTLRPARRSTLPWDQVAGASYYHVQVYDTALGQLIAEHGVTDLGLDLQLPQREHSVFVRATFADGSTSNWAVAREGQAGTYRGLDTVTWNGLGNASAYQVLMYNQATGREVRNTQVTQNSYQIGLFKEPGPYELYVRPIAHDGSTGEWGARTVFSTWGSPGTTEHRVQQIDPGRLNLPTQPPIQTAGPQVAIRQVNLNIPLNGAAYRLEWNWTNTPNYEIIGYDMSAGRQVVAATANVVDPEILIADGVGQFSAGRSYQFFVRGIAAAGSPTAWSDSVEYQHQSSQLLTTGAAGTTGALPASPGDASFLAQINLPTTQGVTPTIATTGATTNGIAPNSIHNETASVDISAVVTSLNTTATTVTATTTRGITATTTKAAALTAQAGRVLKEVRIAGVLIRLKQGTGSSYDFSYSRKNGPTVFELGGSARTAAEATDKLRQLLNWSNSMPTNSGWRLAVIEVEVPGQSTGGGGGAWDNRTIGGKRIPLVPSSFQDNGASVPYRELGETLLKYLPPKYKYLAPVAQALGKWYKQYLDKSYPNALRMHDYLYSRTYQSNMQALGVPASQRLTRADADALLKHDIASSGGRTDNVHATIVYTAVRIGGGNYYGRN